MGDVIDFNGARVSQYIVECLAGFLNDPPDTLYQVGFLAALVAVYAEALPNTENDARLIACRELAEKQYAFLKPKASKP